MPNQQLIDYIKQQIQLGVAKETIKQTLISSGWPEGDVDEGFNSANPAQPATPAAVAPAAHPVTSDIYPATAKAEPVTTVKKEASFQARDSYIAPGAEAVVAGGKRRWILPAAMGLVIVILLGAVGYLYSRVNTLQSDLDRKTQGTQDLAIQLAAADQGQRNLSGDKAKLEDDVADLSLHMVLLVPSSTSTVDITVKGILKSDDKGVYTLTTTRGLVMGIKNYKLPYVMNALKPLLGSSATITGSTVPGSREMTVTSANGIVITEETPATAATTTPAAATTTPPLNPSKPIVP